VSALHGIRVVEVAQWAFVPSAAALLCDLGADVVKIEHPTLGDPYRGLVTAGFAPAADGVNGIVEQSNRGKRSVGLDIANASGRALLDRLIVTADVFLTSFLPDTWERLGIDADRVRACNPRVIYARGHGQGIRGPDATRGAYDSTSFWARGGVGRLLGPADESGIAEPRPAMGDRASATSLAFGITAALLQRERTGEGAVVDVSLLSTAMWLVSSDIVSTGLVGEEPRRRLNRYEAPNPIVGAYRTADGRWLSLNLFESDYWWPLLCEQIGRADLVTDARFTDASLRQEHAGAGIRELEDTFATRTLAEWRECLSDQLWIWSPVQTLGELLEDPQVAANGYVQEVEVASGASVRLVSGPAQIDGVPAVLGRAPEHGEHTEEVLLELGLTWDEIAAAKQDGAIL